MVIPLSAPPQAGRSIRLRKLGRNVLKALGITSILIGQRLINRHGNIKNVNAFSAGLLVGRRRTNGVRNG